MSLSILSPVRKIGIPLQTPVLLINVGNDGVVIAWPCYPDDVPINIFPEGWGRKDVYKKVKVDNDQELAQSERNYHSKNRELEKTEMAFRYLYQENIS